GGDDAVVVEPTEAERAKSVWVAEGDELAFGERNDRIRAIEPLHRVREGLLERLGIMRDERRDHLGVGGRGELSALGAQLLAQLGGVRQVAVVPQRDGAGGPVLDEWLGVRPLGRAGGRVARVPDRDVAVQAPELLLGEDLRDEAHVAQDGEVAAIGDGDSGRLLASVLERKEAEVGDASDIATRRANAEDATHLADDPDLPRFATKLVLVL